MTQTMCMSVSKESVPSTPSPNRRAAGFGDLSGRVALVTGAGRGIGPGIAEALAEAGAKVAINAYSPRYVEAQARRIARVTGATVEPIVGDATSEDGVESILDRAQTLFGGVDICVNGVGDAIAGPFAELGGGEIGAQSVDEIGRIVDLNLTAALLMCRAVAPILASRSGGVVINIAGGAAARGGGGLAAYAAAKTAVVGLTRALALEWAQHGIRVNAIAPGIFPDPDRPDFFDPATAARYMETIPQRRFGTPIEVGHLTRFIASDEASYLTGQTIYLDGGITL
jgi:NAD(P)-dependent dehydrogenase (short-subunit alcohol dehydrogenase family)